MKPLGSPPLIVLALLAASGAAQAQSFGDLLKRGADEVRRATEQAVREAGTAAPPAPSAPVASADLPPGWKARSPYDEERTFVPPQATVKVADGPRQLSSDVRDERKFKGGVISPRIVVDNPYLDPADPFFNIPRQMACMPDGSLAVFSTARLQKDGRMKGNPYATGVWRVAPDGAITAIDRARHVMSEGRDPECGVAAGSSGLDPAKVGVVSSAPDGSLVFPYQTGWGFGRYARVLRLTPRSYVEPVPAGDTQACAPQAPREYRELFKDVGAAARDAQGNTWVMDHGRCLLLRVAADGRVTTVLDEQQVCPPDDPERHVRGDFMAWDPSHGEMVMGGSLLWQRSPKADLYSSIWRVRPDGTFRRVYLAGKVRKGLPMVNGLGGLTLDSGGTVIFGAGIVASGGGFRILRLDERRGGTDVVAGAPRPTDVNHADGPARQAHFGTVKGLCFVPDGTLFVHDANHVIRKVTPAGQVTTWAF